MQRDGMCIGLRHLCKSSFIYGAPAWNMLRSSKCSVAAPFHACMLWYDTCCICSSVRGFVASPTSHMQIIVGFMLCTTLAIVSPKRVMLACSLACLDAFQSILMNTTLTDFPVLCSSGASGLCSVAAVIQGPCLAAAIWVAEGMQAMEARQC